MNGYLISFVTVFCSRFCGKVFSQSLAAKSYAPSYFFYISHRSGACQVERTNLFHLDLNFFIFWKKEHASLAFSDFRYFFAAFHSQTLESFMNWLFRPKNNEILLCMTLQLSMIVVLKWYFYSLTFFQVCFFFDFTSWINNSNCNTYAFAMTHVQLWSLET